MSAGDATVSGNRVEYILRMPRYEMAHLQDPRTLFDHIRFTSGFETGRRGDAECHDDPSAANYLCAANYEFSGPVDRLGVECSFFDVTVPNHIHMLHAERNGKSDQAILDSAFPSATLAFRPPTAFEATVGQAGAGALRVWTSRVQWMLLGALAIAARSRRELFAIAAAFLFGECLGTVAMQSAGWQPSPRFAEAAVALALAYLGLEIVAFPKSRGRWMLALAFGGFSGMYFTEFLSESGYGAWRVISGVSFAGALTLAFAGLLAVLWTRAGVPDRYRVLLSRAAAAAMLIAGSVWFIARLRN